MRPQQHRNAQPSRSAHGVADAERLAKTDVVVGLSRTHFPDERGNCQRQVGEEDSMKRSQLVLGLACLALAIVIFVFADGLRRFYSGGFFLLMAVVLLLASRRTATGTSASVSSDQEQSVSSTEDEQQQPRQ